MKFSLPVILLDELLDKEHPKVASKVVTGLGKFANSGGVVIVSTHRPDHWKHVPRREITLNSGCILNQNVRKEQYDNDFV